MKPYEHARNSVRKWGGKEEDYQAIHDFLDSPKSAHPDMRHRAILHNSFGCYIVEQIFGLNITVRLENGTKKLVSTRDIAERHILEDLGKIPTISDYLDHMPMLDWLGGPKRRPGTFIPMKDGLSANPDDPASPDAQKPTPIPPNLKD